MLGHYGLVNPMMAWLLRRRPELLAETPTEFRTPLPPPPLCGVQVAVSDGFTERCRRTSTRPGRATRTSRPSFGRSGAPRP